MAATNVSVSDLSWGQRFAIINGYKLSDEQACDALGVTTQELLTARSLVVKGVFHIDTTLNIEPYGVLVGRVSTTKKIDTAGTTTKRRGRKGDKITTCFQSIPNEPTPVEAFLAQHGVSLPVLRQFKRFDNTGLPGQVNVRKRDGVLMVWRSATVEVEKSDDAGV